MCPGSHSTHIANKYDKQRTYAGINSSLNKMFTSECFINDLNNDSGRLIKLSTNGAAIHRDSDWEITTQ